MTDRDHAPVGLSWDDLLAPLVEAHGGWTALADATLRRSPSAAIDVLTVEKGLRRLARRGQREGGRYGKMVLHAFGPPPRTEAWARWLAQHHSRVADLPSSVRLEQLRIGDRPPLSESRAAAWIHTGIAAVHHQRGELDECLHRLERARAVAARHDSDAEIEIALFEGRIAGDAGEHDGVRACVERAEAALARHDFSHADRLAYRARIVARRAHLFTRPPDGVPRDLDAAQALFESLEDDRTAPFAACSRINGLAWLALERGDRERAAELARLAADIAADGGLVRFRLMCLSVLSRAVPPEEARAITARTRRMAAMLEDEELMRRTEHDALRAGSRSSPEPTRTQS